MLNPQSQHTPQFRTASDRRDARRMPVEAKVRFLRAGDHRDEVLSADLVDVSSSGVRIAVDQPLIAGESLLIEVRDRDLVMCNLSARVVWIGESDGGPSPIGCELKVELTRSQIEMFRRLMGKRES